MMILKLTCLRFLSIPAIEPLLLTGLLAVSIPSLGGAQTNPFGNNPFGDPAPATTPRAPQAAAAPALSERDEQIQRAIERLRVLAGQGNFEQVFQEANRLLQIDPNNASALWWRDNAQRRLAQRQNDRPSPLQQAMAAAPTPTPFIMPEPLPLAPLPASIAGGGRSAIPISTILIGLGGLLLLGLMFFAVKALLGRRNQAATAAATVSTTTTRTSSVMQRSGSVSGRRRKQDEEEDATYDAPTLAPEQTEDEEEVEEKRRPSRVNRKAVVEQPKEEESPLVVEGYMSEAPSNPPPGDSEIGIDYSLGDNQVVLTDPLDEHDAEVFDLSSGDSGEDDPDRTRLTAPPVAAATVEPKATPAESEPPADAEQTFNSLMFGPGTGPAIPSAPEQRPAVTPIPARPQSEDDLTVNSFDKEFQNVMFGAGAEKTQLAGQTQPAKEAPKPAMPAAGGEKMSMFDRQKDAGRRALDHEDYARAIQCFSVALSLKPGDKEVRDLLEEARKRRRS